jgi:hypothetical protein
VEGLRGSPAAAEEIVVKRKTARRPGLRRRRAEAEALLAREEQNEIVREMRASCG